MTLKILVVDDESATRRVVRFALKTVGIDTIEAANAQNALEVAANEPIGLALIDINLPDIDGFSLIRELRTFQHLSAIPYIIFTARNQSDDEMHSKEVGAAGFLYKPFSTQEIRDLVLTHLSR